MAGQSAIASGFLAEVEALRAELAQADEFHPGRAVAAAHAAIRAEIPFLDRDRALDGEVATAVRLVGENRVLAAASARVNASGPRRYPAPGASLRTQS